MKQKSDESRLFTIAIFKTLEFGGRYGNAYNPWPKVCLGYRWAIYFERDGK